MKSPFPRLALGIVVWAAASAAAFTVSGRVTDPKGAGIGGVTLAFRDEITGQVPPVTNNVTAPDGTYAVLNVPAGTYRIDFTPPAGFEAGRLRNVVVNGDVNLGTLVLRRVFPLSGRVLSQAGVPAFDVDIDVYDAVTGMELVVSGDHTDLQGRFTMMVPPGTWHLEFKPPQTLRLVARRIENVVVQAPTDLGDILLAPGVYLGGRLVDALSQPVPSVDLDVYTRSPRTKILTPGDDTDPNGFFRVVVPTGVFDLEFEPPRTTRFLGLRLLAVPVPADTDIGTRRLDAGLILTGRVVDPSGTGIQGTDLDVVDAFAGTTLFTPGDNSDALGNIRVIVPAGRYLLRLSPPPVSRFVGHETSTPIVVKMDASFGTVPLGTGWIVSGAVTIAGTPLPVVNANLDAIDVATGTTIFLAWDSTDPNGAFRVVLPTGTWHLLFRSPPGSGLSPAARCNLTVGPDVSFPFTLVRTSLQGLFHVNLCR